MNFCKVKILNTYVLTHPAHTWEVVGRVRMYAFVYLWVCFFLHAYYVVIMIDSRYLGLLIVKFHLYSLIILCLLLFSILFSILLIFSNYFFYFLKTWISRCICRHSVLVLKLLTFEPSGADSFSCEKTTKGVYLQYPYYVWRVSHFFCRVSGNFSYFLTKTNRVIPSP